MEILSDSEKLLTNVVREIDGKQTTKLIATFILKKLGDGFEAETDEGMSFKEERVDYWLVEYKTNNRTYSLNAPSDIFTNEQRFSDFFIRYGGSFLGSKNDLKAWVCKLELETEGVEYYSISGKYGKYKIGKEDIWVFRNGFYFRDAFHKPQSFYFFDNKTKGVRFENNNLINYAATFNENLETEKPDISDIISDLLKFFPNRPLVIMIILGFYASTLRYSEFLKILNLNFHFILHVTGETEAGKTELFTLLNTLIGMENVQPMAWQSATNFSNQKHISINSHFPLWRDEYREENKSSNDGMKKAEFLRSVYNRMPVMKGKKDLSAEVLNVVSTLILTGESSPEDPAIQRRCISILMGKEDKVDIEMWGRIKLHSLTWFRFWHFVIQQKLDTARIKKTYNELIKEFLPLTPGATNYAYVFTVYLEIFMSPFGEKEYEKMKKIIIESVHEYFSDNKNYLVPENNLEKFFELILALLPKTRNIYLKDYIEFVISTSGKEIRIYMQGLWELLSEAERNRNISVRSLRNIFHKNFGARIGEKQRINGYVRSCVILDFDKAPSYIQELELYLQEEQTHVNGVVETTDYGGRT